MALPNHLFVSSCDGALYDTRVKSWHNKPPLRKDYCWAHNPINTAAQFKAVLRNGAYAWPGGYPLFFVCDDGGALCFACAHKEAREIIGAHLEVKKCPSARRNNSQWLAVAVDVNWEDSNLYCDHCSKPIESAYGDA